MLGLQWLGDRFPILLLLTASCRIDQLLDDEDVARTHEAAPVRAQRRQLPLGGRDLLLLQLVPYLLHEQVHVVIEPSLSPRGE